MQSRDGPAVDCHLNIPGLPVPYQLNVMPLAVGRKRCGTIHRADSHSLAVVNMEYPVVMCLFGCSVGGQMGAVEMRGIPISKDNEEDLVIVERKKE